MVFPSPIAVTILAIFAGGSTGIFAARLLFGLHPLDEFRGTGLRYWLGSRGKGLVDDGRCFMIDARRGFAIAALDRRHDHRRRRSPSATRVA